MSSPDDTSPAPPPATARPADRRRRAARAAAAVPAALALYVFADLYLRVELPGAAWLAHRAFRALVGPLEWLTEGMGTRLWWAVGGIVVAGALAAAWRPLRRLYLPAVAALLAAAQLVVVALGVLMERALAAGLVAGLLVAAWALRQERAGASSAGSAPGSPPARRAVERLAPAAALLGGAVACYYVYALFMTYGEGYGLVHRLGTRVRGGASLLPAYLAGVGAVGALAAAGLSWPSGGRGRRWVGLGAAAAVGTAAGAALQGPLTGPVPVGPALVVIPAGIWLARWVRPAQGPWLDAVLSPTRWPRRLLGPLLLASLLIGHTYAARVFRCAQIDTSPHVTRVAAPGEVFRVALATGAGHAALTQRAERQLGWIALDAAGAPIHAIDPGPAGWPARDPRHVAGALAGVPEELVYAPSIDRFYATITPEDPHLAPPTPGLQFTADPGHEGEINNQILEVAGDGSRVLAALGVPGLCWINTLRWNDDEQLLYVGCEDRPGVHRFDPVARRFRDGARERAIGDVQKLAFDPDDERLFTVSLWTSARLTELRRDALAVSRQVVIGGSHYDVTYDPRSDRVFASAFYASRVRIVDAGPLRRAGRIPTGFGTRSLAVVDEPHVLLATSVYDGVLRVCEPTRGDVLDALAVGGHVKDLAVDAERGQVYLWSQCGLLRLDLRGWAAQRGAAASR